MRKIYDNIKSLRKEIDELKKYLRVKEDKLLIATSDSEKSSLQSDINSLRKNIEEKKKILVDLNDSLILSIMSEIDTLTDAIKRIGSK